MADTKISEMPAAGTLNGSETVAGLQNGDNVQITTQAIANLASGGGGFVDLLLSAAAGMSVITFTDARITTSSTFDFYSQVFGIFPTNFEVTAGRAQITLSQPTTQQTGFKLRIS